MRTSHMRCKVCHVATVHRSNRFGLCPKHEHLHNQRRSEERRKAKARAARRAVVTASPQSGEAALEEEPMPKLQPEQRKPDYAAAAARLPDDLKLEVGSHYENPAIPTDAIRAAYGLGAGTFQAIIKELKLPPRGAGNRSAVRVPGHFERADGGHRVWVTDVPPTLLETVRASDDIPQPQKQALENMLKLPARPEPVAPTVDTSRRAAPPTDAEMLKGIEHAYQIDVEGRLTISADSMIEALEKMARQQPELRIKQVRELY